MKVEIKKCELKGLDCIRKISIRTFKDTFEKYNTEQDLINYIDTAYNKNKLRIELLNPNSIFYFIFSDDDLAGYMKLNSKEAQTENTFSNSLEIERIYILPAYKRKGLGKKLIHFASQYGKDTGVETIWLGVWEKNEPALHFYKNLGFCITGEHSFMLGQDKQTDYLMTKQI